jgi:hypothetical protein
MATWPVTSAVSQCKSCDRAAQEPRLLKPVRKGCLWEANPATIPLVSRCFPDQNGGGQQAVIDGLQQSDDKRYVLGEVTHPTTTTTSRADDRIAANHR